MDRHRHNNNNNNNNNNDDDDDDNMHICMTHNKKSSEAELSSNGNGLGILPVSQTYPGFLYMHVGVSSPVNSQRPHSTDEVDGGKHERRGPL